MQKFVKKGQNGIKIEQKIHASGYIYMSLSCKPLNHSGCLNKICHCDNWTWINEYKPNQANKTDSLNTLDHLIFVTKGCIQNFSFLGSVEVGYLWLETTTQQQQNNKSVLGATLAPSSS